MSEQSNVAPPAGSVGRNTVVKSEANNQSLKPVALVIFGGGGDLAWRKLVPALFNLGVNGNLPDKLAVIAVDRVKMSDAALRKRLRDGVKCFAHPSTGALKGWEHFGSKFSYCQGDFTAATTYKDLGRRLSALEKRWKEKANHIFYLATPPMMFGKIPQMLAKSGLMRDAERTRVVVEKPIGHDLSSARELNRQLLRGLKECQIYRIDHYLGKETVRNMLAFRFANLLFEPIWNRRYVDHVTITVSEEVGVEHRGSYYEHAGALRDMVQNHLLQLLCLVAMEPVVSFRPDEIRNKKVDVLHAIRPIPRDDVTSCTVRGQYGRGWIRGKAVCGYREEGGVDPQSNTATFAALKLFVDNWRWHDVPFYLRTGKRMGQAVSEVSVQLRGVPHQPFPAESTFDWKPASLAMCIQPDEGIVLNFQAKHPGAKIRLRPVDMRFSYEDSFKVPSPDAYETLLWDVMIGDATLFMRADQVEAAWSVLTPVLEVWGATPPSDFPNYASGTWGPEAAEILIARDGRSWPQPTLLKAVSGRAKRGGSRPKARGRK